MIEMIKVNKYFAAFHVLKDIDLLVSRGEKVVVCGPSGSGKSTLIRLVNRLEEHQAVDLVVHVVPITNDVKNIEMIRREVGMVFQSFNLFPHLTVLENLTLALIWVRKLPKKEAEEAAQPKPVKAPARGKKAAAKQTAKLSDFLASQKNTGRMT